jgi:phenylpropionate dioxygenase-like ring-hydroxylating dioxygenase large terminal subunit
MRHPNHARTTSRGPRAIVSQWVPICPAYTLKQRHTTRPKRVTLHDTTHLAVFWDTASDKPAAVADTCRHRGASLSVGRVVDGCVRCAYHDRPTKPRRDRTIVKDGIVWYFDHTFTDTTSGGPAAGTTHAIPHGSWEFHDPQQRTYTYTRDFPGCNAMYMMENTLDWSHLEHIHAFSFTNGDPRVVIHSDYVASYIYEDTNLPDTVLEVENEWWDTWNTCLRFKVGKKNSDDDAPPEMQHQFSLHFAFVPNGKDGCTIIVRVVRQCLNWTGTMGDVMLMLSNELPLREDRDIVRTIPGDRKWRDDRLGKEDAFLRRFRTHMKSNYPALVSYYTG